VKLLTSSVTWAIFGESPNPLYPLPPSFWKALAKGIHLVTMVNLPDTMVELPDTMVYLPDAMVDLPDTMLDLPDTLVDHPDTMVDLPETMVDLPDTMSHIFSCFSPFHLVFPIPSNLFFKFNSRSSALIALALFVY